MTHAASRSGRASLSPAIAASGFIGVLVGSLLALALRSPASTESAAAFPRLDRDQGLDVTSSTLSGIEEELRSIRMLLEEMHTRGTGLATTRTALQEPATEESQPELAALLADAIAALQRASHGGTAATGLVLPTSPRAANFPDPQAPEFEELMQNKLLTSYQQILDLHGMPDGVNAGDSNRVTWTYKWDEDRFVRLYFHSGLLFRWDGR